MPLAGETITAGKIPGEQVGIDIQTSDSGGVTTTETAVQTVVASVVAGRVYLVRWHGDLASTVAADIFFVKLREDSATGNTLDFRRYRANTTDNYPYNTEVEYTADATEDKTFALTLIRSAGTGTGRRDSTGVSPGRLVVTYVRES
jgi:hypothetical protein